MYARYILDMHLKNILVRGSWSLSKCSAKLNNIYRTSTTFVERVLKLEYDVHSGVSTDLTLAPIVVCHGLFCNKKEWVKTCNELNALTGRKIIAYDAVNHGTSSQHKSMSYHNMALDLVTILEKLDINKETIILGHRMGGKAAMTLALAQPEMISKLVIIDSAPCARKESYLGDTTLALKAVLSVDLSSFKTKEEVQNRIAKINMVPQLSESVVKNITESCDSGQRWTCNLQGVLENYKELISFPSFNEEVCCTAPALFVGDNQKYAHEVPSIMKRFPSAQIHDMDGCDFDIHKSMPADVLNAISEFVKQ